jgi:ribonuclease HI
MSIFCDGACSGNGRKGAVGGWGWAYWAGPVRGEPTAAAADRLDVPPGLPATNQRAELTALLKVLRWLAAATPPVTSIDIYTDSMYTINCTSTWGPAWKKAGWKRKTGEPLLNLDLIVPLVELWRPGWRLHHVRGHQTNSSPQAYGNNWVDQAAVAGAEGKVLSPSSFSLPVTLPVTSPSPVVAAVKGSALPATLTLAQAKQTDIRTWFS